MRHALEPATADRPCTAITHPKCEQHQHCPLCWWREQLRKDPRGWKAYQDELAAQSLPIVEVK